MTDTTTISREREDLIQALSGARFFLRFTARELSDEQAAATPTASELCIGGLIKHVTQVEQTWARFIIEGPSAHGTADAAAFAARAAGFRMAEDETLAGILEHYEQVATQTDELIRTLPSLDADQPLPEAPWFEPGARWSARLVLAHVIAETAQHAGHADIIRETIDGAKSMG